MRRTKRCFGHYGEKEEKNCKDDCFKCNDAREDISEILFCKKKISFPCDVLCDEVKLCKEIYFLWWYKNRDKKCSLKDEIIKFMKENKIIYKKEREIEYGKDKRRTNKNR